MPIEPKVTASEYAMLDRSGKLVAAKIRDNMTTLRREYLDADGLCYAWISAESLLMKSVLREYNKVPDWGTVNPGKYPPAEWRAGRKKKKPQYAAPCGEAKYWSINPKASAALKRRG